MLNILLYCLVQEEIFTLDSYADRVLHIIPATSSSELLEYFPSLVLSSDLLTELLAFESEDTWEDYKRKDILFQGKRDEGHQ